MKIRAIANGDVIEADADAAGELIAAGIYAADEKAPVAPLSTEDLPPQEKPIPAKPPKPKKKSTQRKYKRRDMQAENT